MIWKRKVLGEEKIRFSSATKQYWSKPCLHLQCNGSVSIIVEYGNQVSHFGGRKG
jgi:hypothetical protein